MKQIRPRPKALLITALVALAAPLVLASCANDDEKLALSGGAKDFVMDPKYTEFCAAYDQLNIALNDMNDVGTNKESFGVVLEKSAALVEIAPDDIVDAVLTNDAILNAMNKAFADRNYDEEAISQDDTLRQEIQVLYAQEGLPEMTSKYADYLVDNCGVSTEGN